MGRKRYKTPRYDLEHPDVRWWATDDTFWFQIASKNGCIVNKANIYTHLELFAAYEEKPDASLIRERLLEKIKSIIAQDTADPFHVLLALLELPRALRKTLGIDMYKYAARCDPRVFRLASRIPGVLKRLPPQPTSFDWMYYKATRSGLAVDYRRASEAGSLEATLYLARTRRDVKLKSKYYLHAIRELGFTGIAYEYADKTKNKAILLKLGTPEALAKYANLMFLDGVQVRTVKEFLRNKGVPLERSALLPALREAVNVPDEDEQYLAKLSSLLGYS